MITTVRFIFVLASLLLLSTGILLADPPPPVTNPVPEDAAVEVPLDVVLSWTGNPESWWYNVYFGTNPDPPYVTFHADTFFIPVNLEHATTYYWKINPGNGDGESVGEIWSFTTEPEGGELPDQVTYISPADQAVDIPIDLVLTWYTAEGAEFYQVFLGTNPSPDYLLTQPDTVYTQGELEYETTYYWKINSLNTAGATEGEVWRFTTVAAPLLPPVNPSPANHSTSVPITSSLSWDAVAGASSYEVFFDTAPLPEYAATVTQPNYDPGELEYNTDYYWRILAISEDDSSISELWEFRTEESSSAENPPQLPTSLALQDPYPNPFNAEVTIPFEIPQAGTVRMNIYDVTGRVVGSPMESNFPAGSHAFSWSSSNLASGIYFFRLDAAGESRITKVMALK